MKMLILTRQIKYIHQNMYYKPAVLCLIETIHVIVALRWCKRKPQGIIKYWIIWIIISCNIVLFPVLFWNKYFLNLNFELDLLNIKR